MPLGSYPLIVVKRNGSQITTDYMQGIGHLPGYSKLRGPKTTLYNDERIRDAAEKGRNLHVLGMHAQLGNKLEAPSLTDVLYSLVMDSDVIEYTDFEEWAQNYGYDVDSRNAEKIYSACLDTALKLRRLIDLEQAREAFQDF